MKLSRHEIFKYVTQYIPDPALHAIALDLQIMLDGQEKQIAQLEPANARLLATVRAARDVYSTGFVQMFHQADGRHFYLVPVDDMEELRDKLDAVEDLL